jgi:ribosomal-protein-alanine N-acetyltransferase
MTPVELARRHAASFTTPRPWTSHEFQDLLASDLIHLIAGPFGFALIRIVTDEAELLTIAVDPDMRGQGHGTHLMQTALGTAQSHGASEMFLEVASDNQAACALYQTLGFAQIGKRSGYYKHPDGQISDAISMKASLIS